MFRLEFEILNPKHETNSKSEFSNVQNFENDNNESYVLVICIWKIRNCFGFRNSDFGFFRGHAVKCVSKVNSGVLR